MSPETMLAWRQAKQGRHRLTIPNHIKKALDRLLSKEVEHNFQMTREFALRAPSRAI